MEAQDLISGINSVFPLAGRDFFVYARPAMRGGPVVGYRPTGSFRLRIEPATNGMHPGEISFPRSRYVKNFDAAARFVQRNADWASHVAKYSRLLWMYRKANIVPKRVAKRHAKALIAAHGSYWFKTTEGLNQAYKQLFSYICKYGKCHDCGKTGFYEIIWGLQCKHCGHGIDDQSTQIKWITE